MISATTRETTEVFIPSFRDARSETFSGGTLKRLLDDLIFYNIRVFELILTPIHNLPAIKELVTDANFECNEEGIQLRAMDNSHVALVAVQLKAAGFKQYLSNIAAIVLCL